jgi:hypothetical protein
VAVFGKEDPTIKYKMQLYPEIPKLDKDEQYRFSLLLSHWDVIFEDISLDK